LKVEANCSSEMSMVQSATSINAQSRIECCQIKQGPPATLRQSVETEKAKVKFLSSPLRTGFPSVVSKRRIIACPVDNSQTSAPCVLSPFLESPWPVCTPIENKCLKWTRNSSSKSQCLRDFNQ
jgi:hypothetical protein